MSRYCAVNHNLNKYYLGETLTEVVSQFSSVRIQEDNKVFVKIEGWKEIEIPSYNHEWAEEDKWKDIAKTIVNKLPQFNFSLYENMEY